MTEKPEEQKAPQVEVTDEEKKKIREDARKLIEEVNTVHRGQFAQKLKLHPLKYVMFCQATYHDDFPDTQKCVERVRPYVDYVIIAEDGTLTPDELTWLRGKNCDVVTYKFQDNLPEMRNKYLEYAKKLDSYGWVLVSDPDELMCEKLCQDLKTIVKSAEESGYNMIGIYARDIFIEFGSLDAGEQQKEAPYRESGFWKYLLFKLAPNFKYEGVGHAKNVHESWGAPDQPRSGVHLTKEYYYEHRKTAQKIWRNAARNLFIGGSGDNLGDLNPTYVELHSITNRLNLKTWPQFEQYMKNGNIDNELRDFLIVHRNDSKFGWESEVREAFKWYFSMHPEENTGNWKSEYTAPELGSPEEVDNYVTGVYFEVLGRAPDEQGKNFYVKQILEGKLRREALQSIFFRSEEYMQKFIRSQKEGIALCIMGYHDGLALMLQSIVTCEHFVEEIHVMGDDFTGEDIYALESLGAHVHIEPWKDEFSDYKNKAIGYAGTKWVIILDHDEIPTSELAENLRSLVDESDHGLKYNIVAFDSQDQTIDAQGKVIGESRGHSGKGLLHLNVKDPYYGNPHIWLKPNYWPWIERRVTHAYKHVKQEGVEQMRSIRNVFLGGGGDNVRAKNPLWPPLRQITDRLGIRTYKSLLLYLSFKTVDPELKEWMSRAYVFKWHDAELRAFAEYYLKLHPGEQLPIAHVSE